MYSTYYIKYMYIVQYILHLNYELRYYYWLKQNNWNYFLGSYLLHQYSHTTFLKLNKDDKNYTTKASIKGWNRKSTYKIVAKAYM